MTAAFKIERDDRHLAEAIQRSQGVVEFDLDGNILHANDIFLKVVGYSLEDIKGSHHRIFCEEEYANSIAYKQFWLNLGEGKFEQGEYKRIDKNGNNVWLVATYNPILDDSGRPYKVIKFATNVTESRVELKVLQDIINLTSIVSEADLKGNITYCNDKYCEVSKYSRDEAIGMGHNLTRHPDMAKDVFKEMWATIGRGNMFRGVIKNRAKDGSAYYVDAVVAPVLGSNGKPKKYVGVRYDITEQEVEKQNMRGIFNAINSAYAFIEFDVHGNILDANSIFLAAMGYTKDELKGKNHKIFCEASFLASVDYPKMWENLNSGNKHSGIFKRIKRSGEEVWVQAVYSPVMDEMGKVSKIIKIATDVTEQQQMHVSIQETASTLSSASTELTATASEMTSTSERTSQEAITASAAAEQVAVGVQTVATNIEEMVASIKEIGRSTSESSQMAKMTLTKSQESNVIVTNLGKSSQEIGAVIKVISSIAQQTNLLALNATIEAARAGEAGKGFAVVANEVKELAKQTAKATDDITSKIGAIQHDTQSAVEAIAGISQAVEKLNGISGIIAAAVEEQTATTNEIARVMVDSKKRVESISSTVKIVSMAATESNTSSAQTLAASRELAQLAEKLTALSRKKV